MEWNKDAKKYEEYRYYYADGSQLFRNRLGVNRIYTAVLDSIEYVFNRIKNTKNIDELFVFVTDHGYEGSKDIAIWKYLRYIISIYILYMEMFPCTFPFPA